MIDMNLQDAICILQTYKKKDIRKMPKDFRVVYREAKKRVQGAGKEVMEHEIRRMKSSAVASKIMTSVT